MGLEIAQQLIIVAIVTIEYTHQRLFPRLFPWLFPFTTNIGYTTTTSRISDLHYISDLH